MKLRNVVFLFVVLLLVRVFLIASMPVFDTSEARYAAIAANMDRTGDFLVPHFTYEDRYQSFDGKPPLQFQLSGLCCRIFGRSEFAVRLPVLLATIGMLALLWKMMAMLANRERATLSVGIASTCVAYYALAGCCMPDGLLTPCVASAYFCHVIFLQTGNRAWSLGVFVALALGMLVKGPISIVLFVGPVFFDTCVNHRWHTIARYAWLVGILIFFAIAAPWFVMMARENPDFLTYFFVNENVKRFLVHDYGDKYGAGREFFRGMAAVWFAVVTLPWSPLAGWKLWHGRARGWRGFLVNSAAESVLVWGVLGIVVFWCLTSRVPMAYLMPIVPLFASVMALRGDVMVLRKVLPYAALCAMVVVSGILITGRITSNKMLGDKAPYRHNRYSYEFYHGTPSMAKEVKK